MQLKSLVIREATKIKGSSLQKMNIIVEQNAGNSAPELAIHEQEQQLSQAYGNVKIEIIMNYPILVVW